MAERKPRRLDQCALWDYALRALGGRAHSVAELKEKLRGRAERVSDADAVLARLKEYGYLDDRKFASNYSAARLERQGFGRARVLRDLQQRKVARQVAETAVQETFRETNEAELVEEFLRRKYRREKLGEFLAEPRNLASAYRRLRVAGFSSGAVLGVLKSHAREADLLESIETGEQENP